MLRVALSTGRVADSRHRWERGTLPPYVDLPALADSMRNLHRLEASESQSDLYAHAPDEPAAQRPLQLRAPYAVSASARARRSSATHAR